MADEAIRRQIENAVNSAKDGNTEPLINFLETCWDYARAANRRIGEVEEILVDFGMVEPFGE